MQRAVGCGLYAAVIPRIRLVLLFPSLLRILPQPQRVTVPVRGETGVLLCRTHTRFTARVQRREQGTRVRESATTLRGIRVADTQGGQFSPGEQRTYEVGGDGKRLRKVHDGVHFWMNS
jgi:hypothetical protein